MKFCKSPERPRAAEDHVEGEEQVRGDVRDDGAGESPANCGESVNRAREGGGERAVVFEREEEHHPEKSREIEAGEGN